MRITDKLALVEKYRAQAENNKTSIEVGKSNVDLDSIDTADDSTALKASRQREISVKPQNSGFVFKDRPISMDEDLDIFEDSEVFQPMHFSSEVNEVERDTKQYYESLRDTIISIDCSQGIEVAYKALDNALKQIVNPSNGELSNSQVIIIISTMITKLEELNSYNYPEVDLTEIKTALSTDVKRASMTSNFNEYLFESFYKYYQSIEFDQFKLNKTKYAGHQKEFSQFQQRKSTMLLTLLKWLLA